MTHYETPAHLMRTVKEAALPLLVSQTVGVAQPINSPIVPYTTARGCHDVMLFSRSRDRK